MNTEAFYKYKEFLNGYVFYSIQENFVTVKQICPNKEIKQLLTNNLIKT